jgi:hypothetical protein
MGIIKLTQNLQNFKWTNYDNVTANNSQIKGRHGGTKPGGQPPHPSDHSELDNGAGVPQTFYDGHSKVVTGQKEFERPNRGALADMESRFGPLSTQPDERGPYGVTDYMDGKMQGRGFISPGGPPLGFIVDMGTSEYTIGNGGYTLTPLSHTIAGVNSGGPHGSVPEHTIDIQFGSSWSNPEAINAWAEDFMTTPLANYVSQYTEPVGSATHQVDMITLTGPTVSDDHYLNVTPKVDNAHGSDFTTLPISGYPGLYVGSQGGIVQGVPSVVGLGVSDSISASWPDKIFHQLGNLQDPKYYRVYDHHFLPTVENFHHVSLLTNLFEDEKWRDGSVHIGSQDIASPVGGSVSSFSNLMPIVPRHSMYRDAQGNYRVPPTFPNQIQGSQGTFNIPADYPSNESGLGYTITNQPAGYNWEINFHPIHGEPVVPGIDIDLYESMPKLIKPTPVELKWYFSRVETEEVWPYNQFSFGGNFLLETSTGAGLFDTHPFIRRQVGKGYLEDPSGVVSIDHLATVISRVEEDGLRIGTFMNTPAGQHWLGNQFVLQSLNPREETRIYNPLSLAGSLAPYIHAQRHIGGLLGPSTYMDVGDFGNLFEVETVPRGKFLSALHWGTTPARWAIGKLDDAYDKVNNFFGDIDFNEKGGRLQYLTDKFIYDEPDEGWWGPAVTGLRNNWWQPSGRPPRIPTQTVFSQAGAFGVGGIHFHDPAGEFWDANFWTQATHSPNRVGVKKYYYRSSYSGLDTFSYGDLGSSYSDMVNFNWAYLDPTSYDVVPELIRKLSWEGGNEVLNSDMIIYPGDGNRPDGGTISWTIAGDGTAWSVGDFLQGLDEGEYQFAADKGASGVHSELIDVTNRLPLGYTSLTALYGSPRQAANKGESSHPIWMMPDGSHVHAPTHSPDYVTLKYSELGNLDRRFGSNWSKYYFGSDTSAYPSGILRYSWRFFDPANEKGKLYWGDPAGKKALETNVPKGINLNVFTLGKGSHGNLNPRQALFWKEEEKQRTETTVTKHEGVPALLNGIEVLLGDPYTETTTKSITIISHLKNGKWSIGGGKAPRSSADINFLVLPYQSLGIEDAYGKGLGSHPWPNDDTESFSSLIKHSWRFFDETHIDAKAGYWDKLEPADVSKVFEDTVKNLKDSIFTINEKTANKSELIHKYSTLAYGHIPASLDNKAKHGSEEVIGGSGTDIHDKLNYEKTLRSPSELNTPDVEVDPTITPVKMKRPDWLEALSSKKGSGATGKYAGIRDKAKKIVDDIGQPGKNNIPIVKDGTLGVIKKGITADKYKNAQTDKVNLIPYGSKADGSQPDGVTDFIKFKFRDITNNKHIIFRAILSGISDSITPEWTGTRYIGRPDQVYVYNGAERKVSFSFDIYPKTKQELPVLWEKTNYLVGLCYPSYTSNRMIAPFIELTIGDMFVNTPGFLDSLSVEVDDQGTWEIEDGLQLPKHITCQCSFTYVGKYVQAQKGKHYELGWLPDSLTSDKSIGRGNIGFKNWPDRANKGPGFNKISPLFEELGQK